MATKLTNEYNAIFEALQPAQPSLKDLLDEYRELIKKLEFENRTETIWDELQEWKKANAGIFEEYGLHLLDVFDQIYEELEHLFYPTPDQSELVEKWHRENSYELMKRGVLSYEQVFYASDELTEAYKTGDSQSLQKSLTKLAAIPLMTTEVLQEIIYKSCRSLPANNIVGLDKVTIPA